MAKNHMWAKLWARNLCMNVSIFESYGKQILTFYDVVESDQGNNESDGPASSGSGNSQKNYVMNHSPEYSMGHSLKKKEKDQTGEYVDLSSYNPFENAPKHRME
jgi:hypothetical protein